MKCIKATIGITLLLISSVALAHGFSEGVWALIAIVYSSIIIFGQAILILLLRWAKLFKHRWLVALSFIVSLINAVIWVMVVFVFIYGLPDLFSSEKLMALGLAVVMAIYLAVIVWMFKSPDKQFQQLAGQESKVENTINEALGIKGKT